MSESVEAASASQGYQRSVASIPSRRSLNVQLGPTAHTGDDGDQLDRQHPTVGWTSLEPLALTQRSPRRRLSHNQQLSQQQPQRIHWSRMSTAAPVTLEPPPIASLASAAAVASATATSASSGLCQLVDFGETRDLIRRHREVAKKLAEVNSIVSHLSLEKENSQEPQEAIGWATFRPQRNSQFKQYVFQSPGRGPVLPGGPEASTQPSRQHLQRSRTTLGLVAGRAAARHSRPEPLGAAFRRELTTTTSSSAVGADLGRETSNLSSIASRHRAELTHYRGQGHSSNVFLTETDDLYGQFERRRSRNARLD